MSAMWSSVLVLALLMALDPGASRLDASRGLPAAAGTEPAPVLGRHDDNGRPLRGGSAHAAARHANVQVVCPRPGHEPYGPVHPSRYRSAHPVDRRTDDSALAERRRQPAYVATPTGTTQTLLLDSDSPTAISPAPDRAQDASTKDGSALQRLRVRALNAWESGSLWVALVIGIGCMPPPDWVLLVLAITVTSGAAVGTQVGAAIVFVVGMLAVVEIMLVSYLLVPAKTKAVVQRLHDWSLAHRRQVLIAMIAVAGASLVANGIGII